MAHPQQTIFAKTIIENINYSSILEIGSYDVNGSIRDFIPSSKRYFGVDLIEGPSVDYVYDGQNLSLNKKFDLGLCFEVFEHDPYYVNTFKNLYSHLVENGILIFTCASTGRIEHGTSRTDIGASPGSNEIGWNYYKNLKRRDFENKLQLKKMFSEYFFISHKPSNDLYFVGVKLASEKINLDLNSLKLKALSAIFKYESSLKVKSDLGKMVRKFVMNIDYPLRWFLMHFSDSHYQNYILKRISLRKKLGEKLKL